MNNAGERATTMCLMYLVLPFATSSVISMRALCSHGHASAKRGASSSA